MLINTNVAAVLAFDALTRCVCGSYDAAIEHAEKALQLSPLEPLVYHAALALALACLLSGRTEEAVAHTRKAIEGNRNFVFPYCILALASARLGRSDDAAEAVRQLVRIAPQFRLGSLRRIRLADEARFQSNLELLREAQIPE
jgi:tetratricopeptide (TPR) repeat protein